MDNIFQKGFVKSYRVSDDMTIKLSFGSAKMSDDSVAKAKNLFDIIVKKVGSAHDFNRFAEDVKAEANITVENMDQIPQSINLFVAVDYSAVGIKDRDEAVEVSDALMSLGYSISDKEEEYAVGWVVSSCHYEDTRLHLVVRGYGLGVCHLAGVIK